MDRNLKKAMQSWGAELKLLDSLSACDEPLKTMATLFRDGAHARGVMECYIEDGIIEIYDTATGVRVPSWKLRGILEDNWAGTPEQFAVSLTKKGVDAFDNDLF